MKQDSTLDPRYTPLHDDEVKVILAAFPEKSCRDFRNSIRKSIQLHEREDPRFTFSSCIDVMEFVLINSIERRFGHIQYLAELQEAILDTVCLAADFFSGASGFWPEFHRVDLIMDEIEHDFCQLRNLPYQEVLSVVKFVVLFWNSIVRTAQEVVVETEILDRCALKRPKAW